MKREYVYRVWCVVNPPSDPIYFPVTCPAHAIEVIDWMADQQLQDDGITSNAFGLEQLDQDGEWSEYYDEDGADIMELVSFGYEEDDD